jgi:outer membrane lipoprotein-sorting protein
MARLASILALLLPLYSMAHNDIIVQPPKEKYFGYEDPPHITSLYTKELAEIENYLNSFYNFSAQFKQSNKSGTIRYGKFYISKPSKIRCEYLKPTPDLLIINENKVTFYDQRLDEVSYASADINSLKLLAVKDLRLNAVDIVEIDKDDQFITVSSKEHVQKFDHPLFLTLKFSYPKIELKQVTITTQEDEVDLIFDQILYNQPISKQMFYFHKDLYKESRQN